MKNLAIAVSHPTAQKANVRYARIDGVSSPVWVSVPPVTLTPEVVSHVIAENISDGQYEIEVVPVLVGGRTCTPESKSGFSCPLLAGINARISGGNIIVEWVATAGITHTRITVRYPNGGSNVQNYLNTATNMSITIPIPAGTVGDIMVSGQNVCDVDSGFYSANSQSVVANPQSTGNVTVTNNATSLFLDGITGIPGFIYPHGTVGVYTASRAPGSFASQITVNVDVPGGTVANVRLFANATFIQCLDIVGTNVYSFNSYSFNANDDIFIEFSNGTCF